MTGFGSGRRRRLFRDGVANLGPLRKLLIGGNPLFFKIPTKNTVPGKNLEFNEGALKTQEKYLLNLYFFFYHIRQNILQNSFY